MTIIGSARMLVRTVPCDLKQLREFAQREAALLRKAGLAGVATDAARTAVNVVNSIGMGRDTKPMDLQFLRQGYPLLRYLPEWAEIKLAKFVHPLDFSTIFIDRKNGYNCLMLPINEQNMEKAETARHFIARILHERGYEGWSDDIDREHDRDSVYFIVRDNKREIIATARVSHKTDNNRLPIERGLKSDGEKYSFDGESSGIIEINSFGYQRGHGKTVIPFLFAVLARYTSVAGVKRIYCLVDENNNKLNKLYQSVGFKPSSRYPQRISFPGYGRINDGSFHPTQWKILEMSQRYFLMYSLKAAVFCSA